MSGGHTIGIKTGASSEQGIAYNGIQSVQNITVLNGTATGIASMSNNTGGSAHAIVPPTIIANKLMRII